MDFVKKIGEVQKNHPVVNAYKSARGYEITPTAKNAQEEFAGYVITTVGAVVSGSNNSSHPTISNSISSFFI